MNEKTSQEIDDLLVKIQAHIIQTRNLDVTEKDKEYAKDASEYIHKMYKQREEAQTKRFLEILDVLDTIKVVDRKESEFYSLDKRQIYMSGQMFVLIRLKELIEQAKQKVLEL